MYFHDKQRPLLAHQSQQSKGKKEELGADKRLSLMFGIINEFHTTAVMGVGKPLLQPNTV